MALTDNIKLGFERAATEDKAIRATVGKPADLATTVKTNTVAAINELKASVAASSGDVTTLSNGIGALNIDYVAAFEAKLA
jgi:hypothetical protein